MGDSAVWTSLLIANNLFPPASAPPTFEDGTNQGKLYLHTYATRESYATIYAPPAPRLVCVELNPGQSARNVPHFAVLPEDVAPRITPLPVPT